MPASQLAESKDAASRWAVLFHRALPECVDVEEAVMVADLAFQALPATVALSIEDKNHHLHSEKDGRFEKKKSGGEGAKKKESKDKKGDRVSTAHQTYHELIAQAKKARVDAFGEAKADAVKALDIAHEFANAMRPAYDENMSIDTDADQPFNDLETELHAYEDAETISERKESLKNIEAAAVKALNHEQKTTGDVSFTTEEIARNKAAIRKIISLARDARKQLKAYVEYRKEMKAIKEGTPPDAKLSMLDDDLGSLDDAEIVDASFSHDIFNRKAQGILNRAMLVTRKMNAAARIDLEKILKGDNPAEITERLIKFINTYRIQLADVLTTTQIAALLEGAREVSKGIPIVPAFPGAATPPATLEPLKAMELLDKLKAMPVEERERFIYELPGDQQAFARQGMIAFQQGYTNPPTDFVPAAPPSGVSPEKIHYPIIDEAARSLAEKNVMTKDQFVTLDEAARRKAFTIADVESIDTIAKIRDALAETVNEGVDFQTFRKKVMESVSTGTFLSNAHMETVFRTTVQTAFSDGQMAVLQHPFVRSGFPYASIEPIHDDRARHQHVELASMGIQGTNIYRINDPVFQIFRGPWSWNCRCSWIPMTVRMAASKGITEAQQWLESGIEPSPPEFVQMPNFRPPPGFERSLTGAPLSIRLSMESMDVNAMFADKPKTEKGQWITIGGSKGSDGKRHGGSPVYVVNGRITKGNPKLTGKKLGSLGKDDTALRDKVKKSYLGPKSVIDGKRDAGFTDSKAEMQRAKDAGLYIRDLGKQFYVYSKSKDHGEELATHLASHGYGKTNEQKAKLSKLAGYSDDDIRDFLELQSDGSSHRKEMNREKDYAKAIYAKKARKEGLDPEKLHWLANDIKQHYDENAEDIKSLLQNARKTAAKLGVPIHHNQLGEAGDYTKIKDFDILSRQMSSEYPHLLGAHAYGDNEGYDANATDASEKLYGYLLGGNPDKMTDDDAYEQAFDHLMNMKSQTDKHEAVPFSLVK